MKRLFLIGLMLTTALLSFAQDLPTYDPNSIDVPYKKYVLPNGLRLIVHEDHKAPIVAINVWYHVGSKNENPANPVSHTCSNT